MAVICDKNIIPVVQDLLGTMLDFSVYGLGYKLSEIYDIFLNSKYSKDIEKMDSSLVMGRSGIELCYDITDLKTIDRNEMEKYYTHSINGRTKEYWTGWVLAYYQCLTSLTYKEIDGLRSVGEIANMYDVFHEMDVQQFADRMNEIYMEKNPDTRLKVMRQNAGLSQSELSQITQIPIKTIQQYEQRRKSINNASVDYLISLSKALNCEIELLVEKVNI